MQRNPNMVIIILIVLCVAAGVIWLQLRLSKKPNKWSGLILPTITFIYSLICVFNIVGTDNLWHNVILTVSTLLLFNISTIILLAIYFAYREHFRRKAQIEKMDIQDLK